MFKLIIIRGFPGTGKSTMANKLAIEMIKDNKKVSILENESYFLKNNIKLINEQQIKIASDWVYNEIKNKLKNENIIITNVTEKNIEIQKYKKLATQYNADFIVYRLNKIWLNKCPNDLYNVLKLNFEDYSDEIILEGEF